MEPVTNALCPSCGEETLEVSIDAVLAGVEEVMIACKACESVFLADMLLREAED